MKNSSILEFIIVMTICIASTAIILKIQNNYAKRPLIQQANTHITAPESSSPNPQYKNIKGIIKDAKYTVIRADDQINFFVTLHFEDGKIGFFFLNNPDYIFEAGKYTEVQYISEEAFDKGSIYNHIKSIQTFDHPNEPEKE